MNEFAIIFAIKNIFDLIPVECHFQWHHSPFWITKSLTWVALECQPWATWADANVKATSFIRLLDHSTFIHSSYSCIHSLFTFVFYTLIILLFWYFVLGSIIIISSTSASYKYEWHFWNVTHSNLEHLVWLSCCHFGLVLNASSS